MCVCACVHMCMCTPERCGVVVVAWSTSKAISSMINGRQDCFFFFFFFSGPQVAQSYEPETCRGDLSLTSFFYFTLRGANLLLFYAGSIWIEPPKLLSLLPCKNAIGPMLVLRRWHFILFDC